ncbi:uncharacterized protein involved in propanediol utilization [Chitinivorax tropicus]|uniref:Uncharacterized protein involved in propanediol utilization n=1 Tax=Chitinivorax tropicus TaxID=714531 RepID=A0A840MRU5_9PROT|nr:hypothetical protein [Chitinivorax tropicus]MBB5017941.1 uncharacterized protein involved in propanediol utilization [Chitinivorax tropicus]
MIHSGICHGTLGELFQGPYIQNDKLHIGVISLPIKKYSSMHFELGINGDIGTDLPEKEKCQRAVDIYLARHQLNLPQGRWSHDSELIQGKGMASSTADMVATIRCLDSLFAISSSAETISSILREVERSDSVFLDHYALYLSDQQQVINGFGNEPVFHACYIDEGDIVDTEQAGKPLLAYYAREWPAYARNLDHMIQAFLQQDLPAIARCATTSALLSQGVIPKRHLDTLLDMQAHFRADGIVVAHTGSLLGYLFIRRPGCREMGELAAFFRSLGYQCRFAQTGF